MEYLVLLTRKVIVTVSTQISLHFSETCIPDSVFVHSLTATLRTLDYLFSFHHIASPDTGIQPSRYDILKKGENAGDVATCLRKLEFTL